MKIRDLVEQKLMNEADGDGGDLGGSGGDGDKSGGVKTGTFSQADLDAAVSAATKTVSDKLSAKNSELLEELKAAKQNLKQFDGIDPEKTKQMLAAFENDQDLKDISEGKHEEVIKRRTEKIEANYKTSIESLQSELDSSKKNENHYKEKFESLSIDKTAIEFFTKHKGVSSAVEDIALRARKVWRLEGDEIVARNEAGELITGADGQITMEEWIVGLKKTSPHLFPQSQGSGSKGSGDGDGTGFTITEQMQMALQRGDQKEYQRLRKEAMGKK